jgi:hypothetical protein
MQLAIMESIKESVAIHAWGTWKNKIREVCPGKPAAAPAYKKAATIIAVIHSVSKSLTMIPPKPFSLPISAERGIRT